MKKESKTAFMNALKHVTTLVPCSLKDSQAKEVVKIAIIESGISLKDALGYIQALCDISSDFTVEEWEHIIHYHKNWNGKLGKMLKNFKKVSEGEFCTLATGCGKNASLLMLENKIDEFGWNKVLDALKSECKGIVLEAEDVKCKETVPGTPVMGIETLEPSKVATKTKKVIVMRDADGNSVAEFKSQTEASEKSGVWRTSILKCLNNSYKHAKSNKDGKFYSFEYKEISVTVPAKTTSRKYSFSKIVVLNKETNEAHTYENAGKAADAIGVNKERIYYRAMKAANHSEGNYEFWKESEYVSMAKVA